MSWNEIAFSHTQIDDFLSVVALPHHEAAKCLPSGSMVYRCFCTGFYFFALAIREELPPETADRLLTLAVRVEALALHPSDAQWEQNAQDARSLLAHRHDTSPRPMA